MFSFRIQSSISKGVRQVSTTVLEQLKTQKPTVRSVTKTLELPKLSLQGLLRMNPVSKENPFLMSVLGGPVRQKQLGGASASTYAYRNGIHHIHETHVPWLCQIQAKVFHHNDHAVDFSEVTELKHVSDSHLKHLAHAIIATFSGHDIYEIQYQTPDPVAAKDYFLTQGFKPSIFKHDCAVRFDDGPLHIRFISSLSKTDNPQALLQKIDHIVFSLPPKLYSLYQLLCPVPFWGDVNDHVFSKKIEARQVGMHTEVRISGDTLHPIIYSSPIEVAMVKHFLASESEKEQTLTNAINLLKSSIEDASTYVPDYISKCVDQDGNVNIHQFKAAVMKNQVSLGLFDMNNQLGRSSDELTGFVQHIASLVCDEVNLMDVTEQISFKTPPPPAEYYDISFRALAQRRLIPHLFNACRLPLDDHLFWYNPILNKNINKDELPLYDVAFFDFFRDLNSPEKIRETVYSWIVRPHSDFENTDDIRNRMLELSIPEKYINVYLNKMTFLLPVFNVLNQLSLESENTNHIVSLLIDLNLVSLEASDIHAEISRMRHDILTAKAAGNQLDFELKGTAQDTGLLEQRFTAPQQTEITGVVAQFWELLKRCDGDQLDDVFRVCAGFGQLNFKALMEAQQDGISQALSKAAQSFQQDSMVFNDSSDAKPSWPRVLTDYILREGFVNPITRVWASEYLSTEEADQFLLILSRLDNELAQRELIGRTYDRS